MRPEITNGSLLCQVVLKTSGGTSVRPRRFNTSLYIHIFLFFKFWIILFPIEHVISLGVTL